MRWHQAVGRLQRPGQRSITVYDLFQAGTIEERAMTVRKTKTVIAAATQAPESIDDAVVAREFLRDASWKEYRRPGLAFTDFIDDLNKRYGPLNSLIGISTGVDSVVVPATGLSGSSTIGQRKRSRESSEDVWHSPSIIDPTALSLPSEHEPAKTADIDTVCLVSRLLPVAAVTASATDAIGTASQEIECTRECQESPEL